MTYFEVELSEAQTQTLKNSNNTQYYWPTETTGTNYSTYWYTTPTTIYKYQILCPKPRCKTYNWLELNKEQECSKCGSVLKAVSKSADYEIEVNE